MKIGIIGVGNVGGTLGKAWAAKGHDVTFGVRDRQNAKGQALVKEIGARAHLGNVVVLAVPWSGAQDAVRRAEELKGKILVDVTNPLAPNFAGLSVEPGTSAAEKIAKWAEGARVVKGFNSTGSGSMAEPAYGAQRASMFYCGDDVDAKSTVAGLGEDLGFEMVDAGPLTSARMLETLALLWVSLAFGHGLGPNVAFKLLRR